METIASRRQAAASLPQFSLPSTSSSDIPSTRDPCHLPPIISPSRNDRRVGPHQATAAAPSTAATPTTSSSFPNAFPYSQPIPQSSSTIPSSRTTSIASSSILTPTSGIASDGLSPSSGANSSGSQSTQGGGSLFYQPPMTTGSWHSAASHHPEYTYAHANSASGSSPVVSQPFSQRQTMFGGVSPSIPQFPGRNSSSSTNGDNLPSPATYQGQSPFPASLGSSSGPTLGSNFSQAPGAPAHPALSQPMLNPQNPSVTQPPTPTQQAGTPVATRGQDGPSYRQPPTPNSYYPPSSTPQQGSFPAFPGQPHHSPTTHSPTTSSGNPSRGLGGLSSGMGSSLPYGATRGPHMPSLGSYASPYQMPGPVMSNVHHPGAPLSMVGGMHGLQPYHHQMVGHGHHMYSSHGPPPGDRPFKCDQCPQSFNRNHDLKRHKRIHLAVKPFPCTFCDKSFSRKDALKVSSTPFVLAWPSFVLIRTDSILETQACEGLRI